MKKYIVFPILTLAALPVMGQNMTDAIRLSSKDVAGSARYRAMGGAFGALGGEISAMGDNPAGIGVFRGTEQVIITPNMSFNTTSTEGSTKEKETKFDASFSSIGMVFSIRTPNANTLTNINIGANIRHHEGINRRYHTNLSGARNSMADYMANRANNCLLVDGRYNNPGYLETKEAWGNSFYPISSLLGYKSYAIDDNYIEHADRFDGVRSDYLDNQGNPVVGRQQLFVKEKTRMDEYDFNISANWDDFFYAGITVSVADFNSIINTEFDEDFGGNIYTSAYNDLETKGAGASVKAGILLRPVDNLRLGAAVHTPTWMRITDYYSADMLTDMSEKGERCYSDLYEYRYRFHSPWEYQVSMAYVFGKQGLLSFEYDLTDYTTMKFKERDDEWNAGNSAFEDINDAMKKDFAAMQHTFKAGAELRVTDAMSLRAGYVFKSSPYKEDIYKNVSRGWKNGNFGDDNTLLFDSSTKPNYNLIDNQHIVSCGVGWRWDSWFLDFSVQDRIMKEKVAAFPTTDAVLSADYDRHTVELTSDPTYGAVKANYMDMVYNKLNFDLTIGLSF
ncbi:MAG: hypothetical protein Q4B58_05585 [Bacteroidales bacterium]|nr:hypothetical protein [Bacteroidales bacterium]